jgi:hypothetical protein
MASQRQSEENKGRWLAHLEQMYEELYAWREVHPEASFDEIARQVTPRRQALMGELLAQLACQHGNGVEVKGLVCEGCGARLEYKGTPRRLVEHWEGETQLKRAYYYCPHCEGGVFPPGSATEAGEA